MALIQQIDNAVLNFIQGNMTAPWLDLIFTLITHLGELGVIWIVFGIMMLGSSRYRRHGGMMLAALVLTFLLGELVLVPLLARTGPSGGFSCPGMYAAYAFAGTSVCFAAAKKFGWGALVLAVLIAFSRMYLYQNYLTDVLLGAVLGLLCGVLAVAAIGFFAHPKKAFSRR